MIKRANTINKVSKTSAAAIIACSAFSGPIGFIGAVAGLAIGHGISSLIFEADERLNDNKMTLGMAKILGATENSPAAVASTLHFN